VQIEKRYTQHPPGTVDVLLVRGLTKYLDCQQFAASGQYTRQVGDWCKQALIQIGAPAVPELLVLATNGDQNARRRVGECLGAIKVIGPPGVATLITLLDDAESEVQNSAVRALKLVSNEPTLIPQLIKTFEQGSLKARSSAVGVLGLFQEDRVEAVLLRALDDPDAQVRAWAAYAVLETPHPKLAPELVRRLKTVDNSTLSTLEGALRLSASKIVPDLLRGLQDESPRARAACVRVLFHVLPDHATLVVPALSPLLQDPDPQVRRSLFQVLCIRAYLFDPALLSEPLLKGLDDPNADVRSSAAEALRAFAEKWPNDRRAIDRLLQKLDDPDPAVVAQVIRALAEFREPRAVPQLIRLAAQEGNVGAAAATALGKLGGQNVIDVLRKNLGGKQPEAIAALGELHDFQSIPTFIELLKDSNEFVRTAAAKALAQNPDPRAIMPLIEGLKAGILSEDGPHFVRRYNNSNIHFDRINSTLAIIDALGRSGDSRAIQALIQRIDNADSVFFDEYDFSADDSEEVKFPMESSPRRLDAQLSQHPFAWALFHAGRPAIPELAIGLSSKSRYTRRLCAWVLDNLSVQGGLTSADFEGIRPALLKALDDADPVARYCAVKSVGHLKLRLAEATLLKLLESPLPFDLEAQAAFPPAKLARAKQSAIQIQVEVIRALSGIRTVASRTALLHALDNPAPEVRSAAAGHLGEFPASHTVDPLIKALADPGACAEAARVLGHIGDPRAIPPLIQLLQTSLDPVVKENAAQSLGLIGADSARPALRDVLVQIPQAHARSEGFAIQLAAAISLCQLQDAVGTARIKELLGSSDYETRNQVASKLGLATYFSGWRLPAKLSHEPTRDVLREFAEHAPDTSTRLQLVEALGGQLDEKTRTFLERRANDPHEKISWSIWRVLVRPNPAAYEVQLLKLLDKPEPRVQIEVAGFLGQLSSERVTERLLQLSFDKDVDVRVAAVMALGLHRTPKVDARLEELSHIDPSPKVRGLATMILQSAPKVGQTNKPRAEESELAAREILKGRFGLDLPDPKTEHSPRELILFNIAPAAWEHIGELSDIPAIHVMGGDVRGAPLRQIARIRGLKSLRIVNAKCLPADLESLAGHPSLESLSAMLSVFDELHSSEAARARFVSQLTTSEQAWIKDENSKWLKLHPESNREHILQAAVATDRALVSLAGDSNLKSLELINTYSTRRGFEALQRLPVLESLSVDLVEGSWHIEPRPLTFPKLRKLATSLSNPQLIADIAGSPNLEDLALSGMKDSGVAELIKIPGLKRLKFWANQLSDAGLAGLAELPQLEQINLHQSHGQLTYAGVEKFRMLKPKCAISGDKKLLEPETNNKNK
jgi:HEAT repeat protein